MNNPLIAQIQSSRSILIAIITIFSIIIIIINTNIISIMRYQVTPAALWEAERDAL